MPAIICSGDAQDAIGKIRVLLDDPCSVIECVVGAAADPYAQLAFAAGTICAASHGPSTAYRRSVIWFQVRSALQDPLFAGVRDLLRPGDPHPFNQPPRPVIAHVISSPDPARDGLRTAGSGMDEQVAARRPLVDNEFLSGEV